MKIWLDGKLVEQEEAKTSVFDHGTLYGDGIFEGIRFYNKRVFRLEDHMDRLYNCSHYLLLDIPYTQEELSNAVCETVAASGLNDGAAAIILASGEAVEKYGLKPMAKLIGWGQGGVDPKIMGVGPVPASRQAMAKAGVTIDDIDLVEANEAFAAQSIAVARELHFDMSKVNVNGGAIALGHPVGASGARIIVTLLHEMQKRPEAKKGLATLCIGGGMGTAVVFEKC